MMKRRSSDDALSPMNAGAPVQVAQLPGFPLLNRAQAANRLNISIRTLDGYREDGVGPIFVTVGKKSIRYRVEDLEEYVLNNRFTSTSAVTVAATKGKGDKQ